MKTAVVTQSLFSAPHASKIQLTRYSRYTSDVVGVLLANFHAAHITEVSMTEKSHTVLLDGDKYIFQHARMYHHEV
jgi:hypothetical protein